MAPASSSPSAASPLAAPPSTPHPQPQPQPSSPPSTTTTLFHRHDLTSADVNKTITLGLAISPSGTLYTAWGTVTEILKLPSLVLVPPSADQKTTGITKASASTRKHSTGSLLLSRRRSSVFTSHPHPHPYPTPKNLKHKPARSRSRSPSPTQKPWTYKDLTIRARKPHGHLCASSCTHAPGVNVSDCPAPLPAPGCVSAGVWVDEAYPRGGGDVMRGDGVVDEVLGGVSVAVVEPMGLMEMEELCEEDEEDEGEGEGEGCC
ncbi:uncharacterized protein DSM5745_10404 [Aspergillus mulundensis]|uniref:Uncharacterized protein n=1 Tax=Aspergillus mulundensis TaxID=1810919 RepID=A0A3D8QIT2_9EURO|nr:hypothetical protein DSM5745_10404 [Aspergillus mulundensis]RDW61732.1 hypothetical protein DSM5745_10404 [Aspergillus mulundensis]